MNPVILPPPTPADPLMSDKDFSIPRKYRPPEERWQLIDGVPFMMTPATNRHQRLCLRLANLLNDGLEKVRPDRIALTERGLLVPGVPRFRPIADVAVVANGDGGSYTDEFCLATEILSPSNSEEYIEIKRNRYIKHPDSLYVCPGRVARRLQGRGRWARRDSWRRREFNRPKAMIEPPEFGARFSLAKLYEGTPLVG